MKLVEMFNTQIFLIIGSILITFSQSEDEKPYDFQPESRHLDAYEGEHISVSFQELYQQNLTDFDHCFYESDTISGDFEITKNRTTTTMATPTNFELYSNEVNNVTTYCGLSVENVDKDFPAKFVITVHDRKNDKNYTEEVTFSLYYHITPLLETMYVLEGGSILNYVETRETSWKNCSLRINGTNIELDLQSDKATFPDDFDPDLKTRLTGLGGGRCGMKLINSTQADPEQVSLIATDQQDDNYKTEITIQVYSNDALSENRTTESYLGDEVSLTCARSKDESNNSPKQEYCNLYNPKGELVFSGTLCSHKIDVLTYQDSGIWSCQVGFDFTMESSFFNSELKLLEREAIEVFTEENDDFFTLGCKIKNVKNGKLDFCKFITPNGEDLRPFTGATTDRYTSFTTDLENGKCGIEIKKPLMTSEKGNWKCEIHHHSTQVTGGFINVKNSEVKMLTTNERLANQNVNVKLGNRFDIKCSVPYSSDNCYIKSPDGTIYKSIDPLATQIGECGLSIENATASDHGSWTCLFARGSGIPDEEVSVLVSLVEETIYFSKNTHVQEDEDVNLFCNTGGLPLEYCRFSSPSKKVYSLKQGSNQTEKTSYYGQGLDYGDCGIHISRADKSYSGKWTCHIAHFKDKSEIVRELSVKVSGPGLNTAESVGVSIGVIAAVACLGGLLAYKFYVKKRNAADSAAVGFRGRRSSGSGENIVLDVHQTQIYTTEY